MRKITTIFCALLFVATAFSEDLFDYVPRTSGYLNGRDGFYVQIMNNGSGYNIYNLNGEVGILAVHNTSYNDCVEFIVRLRGWNSDGKARFFCININSESKLSLIEYPFRPDCSDYYCFEGETNDSAINFRDAPGVTGAKLGQYQKGNKVAFSGGLDGWAAIEDAEDYWYSFNYNGETAWMYGKYITFPTGVTLTAAMFAEPQTSGMPAAGTAASQAGTGVSVSSMDMETIRGDDRRISADTYETFETGVSSVTFENNGNGESAYETFTITKGDSILTDLELPWYHYWQYLPETAQLFYADWLFNETYILYGINCTDGTAVEMPKQRYQDELYVENGVFCVNTAGDTLVWLNSGYDYYDCPYISLVTADLTTKETHEYQFDDAWTVYPYQLSWINDREVFMLESRNDEDGYRFSRVLLEGDRAIITDSFTIEGDFYISPEVPHTCRILPGERADQKMVLAGNGMCYSTALLLTITNDGIQKQDILQGKQFINQFWYEGKRYFAVIERDKTARSQFSAIIYDNSLHEINRKSLSTDNTWDEIRWIGVRDGKLLVSLILDK